MVWADEHGRLHGLLRRHALSELQEAVPKYILFLTLDSEYPSHTGSASAAGRRRGPAIQV